MRSSIRRHDEHRSTRRALLLAAIGAAVARAAGAHELPAAPNISGFELPQPMALHPFALRTVDGTPYTERDLRGRWSFVFFGFTSCPDVCPTTMLALRNVRERIVAGSDVPPNRVLFVSIDPARDTPAKLADYASRFGSGVTAVTASDAGVRAFADQFRVKYEKSASGRGSPGSYQFDHTASVSLVGPDARLYAVFTLPLRTSKVAADVQRIHAKHRAAVCPRVQGTDDNRSCSQRAA